MGLKDITINNTLKAAVKSGAWTDPGAKLYNQLLDAFHIEVKIPTDAKELDKAIKDGKYLQYSDFLNETYLQVGTVNNSPYGVTPYTKSGCKYPHHVIRNGELVVSIPGLKAAYKRAKQMGIFKGKVKEHLERHYKELGLYEDSTMNTDKVIKENFDYIESFLGIDESKYIKEYEESDSIEELSNWIENEIYNHNDNLLNESTDKSVIDRNFKKKDNKDISFKILDIHDKKAFQYIKNDLYLRKIKISEYNGEIIIDNNKDKIIGRFLVMTGKNEGFIGALRVYDNYKGYGFGDILIDDAIKKYNGIDLIVMADNKVAIKLYKNHGFVQIGYGDSKNELWMKLKSKLNKNDKIITESKENKIDTVIFDLGSVLIKNVFRDSINNSNIPDDIIEDLILRYANISNNIKESMSPKQAIDLYKDALPDKYKKYAKEMFTLLNTGIEKFDYTESMLKSLKNKGYKIYYLSNWNKASFELCKSKGLFEFLDLFDGGIISYEVGMMKPEENIYKLLIKKYNIIPNNAIFFDDKKENVDAAKNVGLSGKLFDSNKHSENEVYSMESIMEAVENNESLPKQVDKKESDKNGNRRKKLYISFIEWAKSYNNKNSFGSIFDKDIFKVTYPFIPDEMRYFYRIANPLLCVLSGNLTFFQVSELKKLNEKNDKLNEFIIFAATEEDFRIFNIKDKRVYLATEENEEIKIGKCLATSFDLYIQNMINKGDILNAPLEDEKKEEAATE